MHLNTANSIPERFQVTNVLDPQSPEKREKWKNKEKNTHTYPRILRFNCEYTKRVAITHVCISKAVEFALGKAWRRKR